MQDLLKFFIGGFLIIVTAAIILGLPVMLLWNLCLAPAIDGINSIGFKQAIGINVLCTILFKPTFGKKN